MSLAAISSASRVSSSAASDSERSATAFGSGMHQRAGGGPGRFGDLGAGEHAGDLLLTVLGGEDVYVGPDLIALPYFDHPPMAVSTGGDLGAVGDDENLGVSGEALQAQADRVGDRAADALVHLVEDHQRLRAAAAGERHLQRQCEAGKL